MDPAEERAMARRALESLVERDKVVLFMREQGLSYDQIAVETHVVAGSVGTTLARARRKLSERFEQLKRGREALGRVDS